MSQPAQKLARQCAVALGSTLVGLGFSLACYCVMPFSMLPLFLAPVVISARYCGLRAGLMAAGFSGMVAAYFFVPPFFSWSLGNEGLLQIALFLADSGLILWLTELDRRLPGPSAPRSA